MLGKLDKSVFLWEKKFTHEVWRLAWPIMIQSLIVACMFIVDNVMIGQLGNSALAGVTQANRVTFLLQVTMFGVVSGASVFTAQYWGTRDLKGIHATLGLAMMMAAGIALLFALPAMTMPERILRLFLPNEDSAEALDIGAEYLRVIGLAYILQAVSMVQSAVLRSTQQVRLPMYASMAAIVTNASLNALLIFGLCGFPRLGAMGGAIATTIGCAVELAILMGVGYRLRLPNAARLRALNPGTRADIKRFLHVMWPIMVNESFWGLGVVLYSAAYGIMGENTVAADSIFRTVEQLAGVALRGTTHSCAVLIGISIGAGRDDEARLTAKRMMVMGAALGLLVGAVLVIVGPFVVRTFPVTQGVAASANALIRTYALTAWNTSCACVLIVGILRAGGDVRYAMLIDVLPVWLIGIPLVFITGPVLGWPIELVYLVSRIEEFAKVVIGFRRMLGGTWVNNLVGRDAAGVAS